MTVQKHASGPLIIGATGAVGQALARCWPAAAGPGLWQHRPASAPGLAAQFPGPTLAWDILATKLPPVPRGLSGMIVLAGVMGQDEEALAQNTDIALAAVAAAQEAGLTRVLIASTQAVYGTDQICVSETDLCQPTSPYGQAKLRMEQALAGLPNVTNLRLGNVAGADSLFRAAGQGTMILDRFADGSSPQRSYIGPVTLARVLSRLLDPDLVLPSVVNVAHPGVIPMDAILNAAGVPFEWRAAPATALHKLEIDVTRLNTLVPMPSVSAAQLVAEAASCGWSAA
ncbi:MAG: NAD-dependent epimerase/dehydratase family protein [Colwellia sp.]|nr:NAD-dependent epimerase/dehydratase family protein [Colwellia sp.]